MQFKVWFREQDDADWWFAKLLALGIACRVLRDTKVVIWDSGPDS